MSIEVSTTLTQDDLAEHANYLNFSITVVLALTEENLINPQTELMAIRDRNVVPEYAIKRLRDLADAIEKEL